MALLAFGALSVAVAGFAAASEVVTISIVGRGPQPQTATVALGDTVVFRNDYVIPYRVSADRLRLTTTIPAGDTFTYVATRSGTYGFTYQQVGPPDRSSGQLVVLRRGSVTLAAVPGTVVFGRSIDLSGTTSLPGFPVEIQRKALRAKTWARLLTVDPAADGAFTASVSPAEGASYRASVLGNQLVSQGVRIVVTPNVRTRAAVARARSGSRVRVTVTIVPTNAARSVLLMRYDQKARAWRRTDKQSVSAAGRATFLVRIAPGRNVFRGRVTRENGLLRTLQTTVGPPATVTGIGPDPNAKPPKKKRR